MPLNIKHQIAIAVGTAASAACLIGFLKSDSTEQEYKPLTTVAQLSELNSRLSDQEIPSNSVPIAGLKALPQASIEANGFPVVTSSRMEELELAPEMNDEPVIALVDEQFLAEESELEFLNETPSLTNFVPLQLESPETIDYVVPSTHSESEAVQQQAEPAAPTTSLAQATELVKPRGPRWTTNPHLNQPAPTTPTKQKQNGHVTSLLELSDSAYTTGTHTPAHSVIAQNNAQVHTSTPIDHSPTIATQPRTRPASVDDRITPFRMNLSEATALQAVHHIEYGKALSRRGAAYAAQQEFFAALRVIAQANDALVGGNDFSKALTDAIRAMKEAEDFTVQHSASGAVVNVAATIEPHRTKLFTENEAKRATSVEAMQRYYAFAEQQLDFAGGRNVVTAEALGCLGKLHSVMALHKKTMPGNLDIAKAIVFHKTSLLSNPNNPAAANELGVLMAKTGQLNEATKLFKQSLIARATPQAWQNLAKTHHRLGEPEMARMAETELAMAAQSNEMQGASGIQWIQVPQFNAMAPMEFEPRVATQTQPIEPMNMTPQATEKEEAPQSLSDRIKGWF